MESIPRSPARVCGELNSRHSGKLNPRAVKVIARSEGHLNQRSNGEVLV